MRKIKIGIDLHNRASVFLPEEGYDFGLNRLVDLAVYCEELGFDFVSVGDSLLAKPRWRPIPTLAAIAAKTERIEIGTHILMPHLYNNPVMLAQELATVDQLSNGRLRLGLGIGAGRTELVEREHRLCGIQKSKRGRVFDETLRLLKMLWTEEEVTFEGEFYHLDRVRLGLRPHQKPHPPIWVAAGIFRSGQSGKGPFGDQEKDQNRTGFVAPIDRVARLGDGWLGVHATPDEYRETLNRVRSIAQIEYNRDPSTIQGIYSRGVYVDEDTERAFEDVKWWEYKYHAMPVPDETIRRWTIFGTGPECVNQMKPHIEAGVDTFIICQRARDPFKLVERLGKEVLPAFK